MAASDNALLAAVPALRKTRRDPTYYVEAQPLIDLATARTRAANDALDSYYPFSDWACS